ncbi:hypothetical protein [Blastococcus sp. VKM Ac-2987]|uniref:hypothetical protein n=1 Tax=Blastococcus sp. VKM Ac-2987 TaxID=3004141 RepID=UPI0022AB8503|nr:hypothetical protein [Blastococcus sp. VKM Ac-2987]MCZ2859671.1 hypothetical protein [Blastococcus sp. VKM Ac-2987]
MLTPSADAFAALARSSPWRWTTLRFSVRWPQDPWKPGAVRAWLRRPDALRVETVDGALLQVVREPARDAEPQPRLRPDGLVAERREAWDHSLDDPMHQDYHWVAMLDPAELADGRDPDTEVLVAALEVDSMAEVEHGGRPAWEAVVLPTDAYEPRCGCCPLLRSRDVDLDEYRDHPQHVLATYPDAFRVRLDVQTGVCVLTEAIGGEVAGRGHDLRIEAVDGPMADDLFVEPRRERLRRRGWSPYPARPGVQ